MYKQGRTILLFIFILMISNGCRRTATWSPELLMPLFKSELDLNDVNGEVLKTDLADSSFDLVYDKLIYSQTIAQVNTPDTSVNTSFNLTKLKLSDRTINQKITLAQINPIFAVLDGRTTDVPAQNLSSLNPVDIDASEFFEIAVLDSGLLDITLKNELPVTVSIIEFEIRNADDNLLIAKDTFQNLTINTTRTKTVDLAGKTVKKNLKGVISRLETLASSGPVLIEAQKGVIVTLGVRKLRPRSAIAAFPNQTVIEQDEGLTLDMGGPQVKFFKVKSGKLRINLISTIQEDMTLNFEIPSATYGSATIQRTIKLPGAPTGSSTRLDEVIDMAGYLLDFRGKNPTIKDTVNTFHQKLRVTLDSSGRKVAVSLKDSIRILYQLEELVPEYAIGYLGQTLNDIPLTTSPFALFKGLSGDIDLRDLTASILVKNGIGAQGRIKVKTLEGRNIFTNNTVALSAVPFNSDILINPAIFNPFKENVTQINLDGNNSNIKSFAENLPQELRYAMEIETNPNGNISNWNDFVYDFSKLDVYLRVETPASLGIGGLTLRDTQPVFFSNIKNLEKIKGAKIFMEVVNDYAVEAIIELTFLDADGTILGAPEFIGGNPVIPPGFNNSSGYVQASKINRLELDVPPNLMEAFKNCKSIGIKVYMKSAGGGHVKLYNTQKIKIKTSAQFTYEAGI